MPSLYDDKAAKSAPETIDIVPQNDVIQFHEPPVKNRMINAENVNNDRSFLEAGTSLLGKYASTAGFIGLGMLVLLSVTFVFVRSYRGDKKSQTPPKSDNKSDKRRKDRKDGKSKRERRKRKSSRTEHHHKKRRKSEVSSAAAAPSSSSSSSVHTSSSEASSTNNSSTDATTRHHRTKRRKTRKRRSHSRNKSTDNQTDAKGFVDVKMVPLTERHPTKVSLRALNRQLTARNFFEDKLKTLRDGSERERMLRALREMQVTTRWPELKTEDISSDSLEDLPKHERTALSPFINYQRPRLMANPASAIGKKHSSHVSGSTSQAKVSYYRYKEMELAMKNSTDSVQGAREPVAYKPARVHSQITPRRLEEFFSLEKLSQWQKDNEQNDSSESSSDSLKMSGALGRDSQDESFVMYSRDANPRRIRDHSILHARPTPPETIDDTNSPPTPTLVRKTLAARSQSRTVRFDRFTKRYFV